MSDDIITPASLADYALMLADDLDRAERIGAEKDEPEGVRFIMVSDTLAKKISADLRERAAQE